MKYLSEEQNKCFVGTGELNKAGDSLAVFLDKYDPDKYQNPCNTVDTLVFTKEDSQVKRILLIKRGNHPCIGLWACPGGFVEFKENLYDAALRELQEETGLHDIEAEQLKSYGDYDRDPRTRIITTAFVALIDEGSQKAQAGDDAREAGWFDISDELVNKTEDKSLVNGCVGCPMQIRILISVQEWKLPIEKVSLRTAHIRLLTAMGWQQIMRLLYWKDTIMLRRHLTHE